MPYTKDNPPAATKGLPAHAQDIFIAAANAALEEYEGDEGKAHATAWTAVKTKYHQVDGKWVAKAEPMDHVERRIAVFKAGDHTDSQGRMRTWTKDDLAKIAAGYNPEHHEAPIVVGHPKDNSPAFGWTKSLTVDDDGVMWANTDLLPEFDELVQKGAYKKRSISLYGDMTLRHVGFLGAQPPAVKGLPDLTFADDQEEMRFEFNDRLEPQSDIQHKEDKKMALSARQLFQDFVAKLRGQGVEITDLDAPISFTEEEVAAKVAAETVKKDAEFAEERKRIEAERKELDKARMEETRKGIQAFIEAEMKAGRLTPAMAKTGMGLVTFMEQIANMAPLEFGEADKKATQAPVDFLKGFLAAMPKLVNFSKAGADGIELEGEALRDKVIQEYLEEHKCGYEVAVTELIKTKPELFQTK